MKNFYTTLEAAEILRLPHRRVLERLASGELAGGERDPFTGRWKIPKETLDGSGAVPPSPEGAAWREEKELLLAELHKSRARADREHDRAERERVRADRERERAEKLREKLKAERARGVRWRPFGG